ncbi:dehydrogenase/reductase SDR family member 4-like [Ctenocephalides felis]|uniref:dehydrogenase/reductase SDR family member 4-like n=2 Tax=Ctenocephalides felis TaxID=7515 RepID=UPI000E6E257E|nr:dehydrogenase/reductase SDR family member 4-like [Ctenocephalides felis]
MKLLNAIFNISRTMHSTSNKVYCNRLTGKVAVVTASTDGIGFAIAKRLGVEGAKVVVSSRKSKNVESAVSTLLKEGLDAHGVVCHVSKAEDRKALYDQAVQKYGGIDILVSNAAVNPTVGHVLQCDEQSWDKIFDVNVKSSFLLAKEVLPYLRKRGGGSIVFVSSIAGLQPFPILGAYSVSKTALFGLTKAASHDLASENIRVNCIAPGIVKTKFSSALHESETAKEAALMNVPMRRLADPSEMSGVVAFLVSDDASYITGETLVAAGGMPSRL